jgi:hypothetical protein
VYLALFMKEWGLRTIRDLKTRARQYRQNGRLDEERSTIRLMSTLQKEFNEFMTECNIIISTINEFSREHDGTGVWPDMLGGLTLL